MEREVVVRGTAEVRVMPDQLTVSLTVEGESSDREDAYAQVARAARSVDEVVERRAAAIGSVTSSALVVQPKSRWRKGETVRTGWRALRSTSLQVRDLDRAGEIVGELVAAGAALSAASWAVDPDSPAHTEARSRAALDARSRAATYAEALGIELGPIAWVAEPGLRVGGGEPGGQVRHFMAAAGGRAMDAQLDVVDLAPEELTVTASVEVGFSIGG